MACSNMEDILDKFNSFTQKPAKFLSIQDDVNDDIKHLVKSLYDFTKSEEQTSKKVKKSALPELIVQDFDEEQIWQEIELQNSECWDQLVWEVANSMAVKSDLKFPIKLDNEPGEEEQINEPSYGDDNNSIEDGKIEKRRKSKTPQKKIKQSIVDDKFFKLQEMEQFLLKEEKNDSKQVPHDSDEESIDMFEDVDDDGSDDEDGTKAMKYYDFFDGDEGNNYEYDHQSGDEDDENEEIEEFEHEEIEEYEEPEQENPRLKNPNKKDKKVTFADAMSENSSEDSEEDTPTKPNGVTNEKKSEFELRQQRLKQQIERLEEKNLNEAPWQLKGEIDGLKRPQNSLLQEVLEFDLTTRPPPIITEQTTVTLEDLIRRRIKDKAWDDVIRKEKPVNDQLTFRKTEVLDHSKSKQSLAQVYEAEYLKQKSLISGEVEEEKEPDAHTQIRDSMTKLFGKLDALCHYHYTPKPAQAEVKIVSNTPAISMEEVAPVATSDAALLAPEEVKKKRRGDLMSKEERTKTDKNRERRKKKKHQKLKGNIVKVTDNRNTKKGVEADDKSLKTSKAFFQQLNDDSNSLIKTNKNKHNVTNKGQ